MTSPTKVLNPFARASSSNTSDGSFKRTSLLPTVAVPVKHATPSDLTTPGGNDKRAIASDGPNGSASRPRSNWRLLWRGGLEVGPDGWRLDGVTFFALLSFPSTPSGSAGSTRINPFSLPTPVTSTPPPISSPLHFPSTDTDLCLSLESMRGRKHLAVRGVVQLLDDEVLEGDDGGVQMSVTSPLLVAFFTGVLCRTPKLSPQGRTSNAVVIGLGDEGIDESATSSIVIYGQLDTTSTTVSVSDSSPPTLRMCVGRRRARPTHVSAAYVRPGEPLPRAPLFFPVKAPSKPPPPFPRRSLSQARSFSRAPSVSSIYAPPFPAAPQPHAVTANIPHLSLPNAPVSGRTPGRRGEKRPRRDATASSAEDDRRRKSGKIIVERDPDMPTPPSHHPHRPASASGSPRLTTSRLESDNIGNQKPPDEDIFGKQQAVAVAPRSSAPPEVPGSDRGSSDQTPSSVRPKRIRVPQQILDNKATIRKQTLLIMDARGYSREHPLFKDVFGMATKGAYFAFRDTMETGQLDKSVAQDIIGRHLDMYLPEKTLQVEGLSVVKEELEESDGWEDVLNEVKMEEDIKPKLEMRLISQVDDGAEAHSSAKIESQQVQDHLGPMIKSEPALPHTPI